MPLKIEATNHNTPNPKMSYSDFFIRFEHKFLRNIYSDEEIEQSPQFCTLENYYETYQKFIKISISLLSIFGSRWRSIWFRFKEILLPNLVQKNSEEDSEKDYNYKVCYNMK